MPGTVPRVLVVLGTRPEAVKLAPVIRAARGFDDWEVRVCSTGQHADLVPPVLTALGIEPDLRLGVMRAGQALSRLLGTLLERLDEVMRETTPDWVVVQGDTATVLGATLAAYHQGVSVAHVEAGLRTGDLRGPFPEEGYRRAVSGMADLHFAPTPGAAAALRREGVSEARIVVTGNTVVDAVQEIRRRLPPDGSPPHIPGLHIAPDRGLVLVTAHRRESAAGGLRQICSALGRLAAEHRDVDFVLPLHRNPAVREVIEAQLRGMPNLQLLEPVSYEAMIWMLGRSRFVITDSGGLQEEAPVLGKPVIVTREHTERIEAVEQGSALVVGWDAEALFGHAHRWLSNADAYAQAMPHRSPFGDGRAAPRCIAALRERLGLPAEKIPPFA